MFNEEEKEKIGYRYYDEDVHKSSFILPRSVKKVSWFHERKKIIHLLLKLFNENI